jgi:hypothetical protein
LEGEAVRQCGAVGHRRHLGAHGLWEDSILGVDGRRHTVDAGRGQSRQHLVDGRQGEGRGRRGEGNVLVCAEL